MADNKPIEIKIDNKEVLTRLQELASRGENLRPLMKNIAGIMATATEDNFKDEGRPEKWVDLSETTKSNVKNRQIPRTNSASFRSTRIVCFNSL